MDWTEKVGRVGLVLLPAATFVYLSFNGGGFFPNTPAFIAIILIEALVLRVTLSENPISGLTPPLIVAACALAFYAGWTLLSATWSDSTGRALIEFDRALLYLVVLLLMGSVPREPRELRWILRCFVVALFAVCTFGLVSRTLPNVLTIGPNLANDRLSYPLTYWNALGVVAAIGFVLSLQLSSDPREPRVVRVAAALGPALFGTTVLFTFSRGAIVAGVVGVVVYAAVARARPLVSALIATVPPTAVAVIAAYHADRLATTNPTGPIAVHQGKHVALVLAACLVFSVVARALLLRVDERIRRFSVPGHLRAPVFATVGAAVVIGAVSFTVAADVPHYLKNQYDRFVEGTDPTKGLKQTELRKRLTDPSSNGRLEYWKVALRSFDHESLHGSGAGTYALRWWRDRGIDGRVTDAHGLYFEVMGELGIVGIAALVVAILAIFFGIAQRIPGRRRALYGGLMAAGVVWAVHAGADWDWEMPATTLWFFAIGGAAISARPRDVVARASAPRSFPVVVGLALLATAVTPVVVVLSESRLHTSGNAFRRVDCRNASRDAVRSIRVLSVRGEPYEILGYCDLRRGYPRLAVQALHQALRRDPDNWGYHYGMAVALGADGRDPRPEARRALRLNRREQLVKELVQNFDTSDRSRWRTQAEKARVRMMRAGLLTFE